MQRDPFAYIGESGFNIRFDAGKSVEDATSAVAVFEGPNGDQKNMDLAKVGDGSLGILIAEVPADFFDTEGGWSVQLWVGYSGGAARASDPRPLRISGADDRSPF